jgi:hypothetical protein
VISERKRTRRRRAEERRYKNVDYRRKKRAEKNES